MKYDERRDVLYRKIVKKIKGSKTGYFWARILHFRKDEDFREYVRGFQGPDVLMIKHFGLLYPEDFVYYIDIHDMVGFFAMMQFTLEYLSYAEKFHFIPVINWKGVYAEKELVNNTDNVFEYYYCPVSEISKKDVPNCKNVIFSCHGQRLAFSVEGSENLTYKGREEIYLKYSVLYKKYCKLNEKTQDYIDENRNMILGGKKTLGVHIRGTDFKQGYNVHPVRIVPGDFVEPIKKVMGKCGYEQIFLATDSLEAITLFQKEFGDRLVFYQDVQRSDGNIGVQYSEGKRKNHHYLLGLEVLRDVYTLSACDSLVSGLSNVSSAARYIKAANGFEYREVVTLDHGLNVK